MFKNLNAGRFAFTAARLTEQLVSLSVQPIRRCGLAGSVAIGDRMSADPYDPYKDYERYEVPPMPEGMTELEMGVEIVVRQTRPNKSRLDRFELDILRAMYWNYDLYKQTRLFK